MNDIARSGRTIRPSLRSLWLDWLILAVSIFIIASPTIYQIQDRFSIGEDIPINMIVMIIGVLGAFYSGLVKIAYSLLANRYYLTDSEVVEVYGLIQKNRKVTRLEHIRRVSVEIGIVGRILGFGDVLYFSAGSGGVDVRIKGIKDPEGLAKEADALAQSQNKSSEEHNSQYSERQFNDQISILDDIKQSVAQAAEVQSQLLAAFKEVSFELRRMNSWSDQDRASEYSEEFGGSEYSTGHLSSMAEEYDLQPSPKMFDAEPEPEINETVGAKRKPKKLAPSPDATLPTEDEDGVLKIGGAKEPDPSFSPNPPMYEDEFENNSEEVEEFGLLKPAKPNGARDGS